MPNTKFTTTDKVIIVAIIALYVLGYHFLISSGNEQPGKRESRMVTEADRRPTAADPTIQKRTVRSLNDWPEDLGKYFYTIDIDPGYEMEGEEWVEVEKVGDRYYV